MVRVCTYFQQNKDQQAEVGDCELYFCIRPYYVDSLCDYINYGGLRSDHSNSIIRITKEGEK